MSKGTILCAVLGMMMCAGLAQAGQPSAAKMRQMGLEGAPVVSDSAAMEVRGMGYAAVWGSSSVKYFKHGVYASAHNGYKAGGQHAAIGGSLSVAGNIFGGASGSGWFVGGNVGVAGGFAAASAH